MPMYDYKCPNEKCETKIFEKYLSVAKCEDPQVCKECGTESLKVVTSIGEFYVFGHENHDPDDYEE